MKIKYNWEYGENKEQTYYEAKVGNDYLCVYANRWSPQIWMAIVNDRLIHNKTRNNRQRKKQGLPPGCDLSMLQVDSILSSDSPEYMMKKAEWRYQHGMEEISE